MAYFHNVIGWFRACALLLCCCVAVSSSDHAIAQSSSAQDAEWDDPTNGMFAHPSPGPDIIARNETGIVKVQVDALIGHPDFVNAIPLLDTQVATGLQGILHTKNPPVFHLKDLRTIACNATFRVGFEAGQERAGRLMFGIRDCTVDLQKPVDLSWLTQNSDSVKLVERGARKVYEISSPGMFGPKPVLIASRSKQTICLSNIMIRELGDAQTVDDLVKTLDYKSTKNTSPWASAFRNVDGGILTLAIPHRDIDLRAFERLGAGPDRATKRIFTHSRSIAIGIDWNNESQLGIRIRLAAANPGIAKLILNDVKTLQRYAKRAVEDASGDEKAFATKFNRSFLSTMVARQQDDASGSSGIDIRATAPFSMVDVIGLVLTP